MKMLHVWTEPINLFGWGKLVSTKENPGVED